MNEGNSRAELYGKMGIWSRGLDLVPWDHNPPLPLPSTKEGSDGKSPFSEGEI